ncbi:transcription antitermination protein NusB [Thermoleptolyngbya sichuanensis A183]|uniref:Transcription antitermination protein NusB n=1 Tax=Thermoleptolyngbya sichuanensis A183 TaxID=2737172 RepID=A0A6M8B5L6_9CYAN|nr:transcription antitermination factor NusB [Thermoleptolyngbya sichuanensis]QKD81758.1 transcription antitermination protein NusB [Thermoleptolyngbya sichuanensis A183]
MQARRIARELALLSVSQLPSKPEKLEAQQLQSVALAAVRTLTGEAHDMLETAAAEVERGSDRLLASETKAQDLDSARVMVKEALELAQAAINRIGTAVELPEILQLANHQEVRDYTLALLQTVSIRRAEIDQIISAAMVDWQLHRLPQIDRDILRLAVAEFQYMGIPDKVAINEAVELAKRYSDDDGHRFINGVLRRVVEKPEDRPEDRPEDKLEKA